MIHYPSSRIFSRLLNIYSRNKTFSIHPLSFSSICSHNTVRNFSSFNNNNKNNSNDTLNNSSSESTIEQSSDLEESSSQPGKKIPTPRRQLFQSIVSNDLETVLSLFRSNQVGIDITNVFGETPLMTAAKFNNVHLIELFLQLGAQINNHDNLGNTALDHAILNNNFESYEMLLNHGGKSSDPNFLAHNLENLLHNWSIEKQEENNEDTEYYEDEIIDEESFDIIDDEEVEDEELRLVLNDNYQYFNKNHSNNYFSNLIYLEEIQSSLIKKNIEKEIELELEMKKHEDKLNNLDKSDNNKDDKVL